MRSSSSRAGRQAGPLHSLTSASWLALGCATMLSALPAAAAQAQSNTATPLQVEQAAGPLLDALRRFALQSGVAIVIDPALTQGRQAPALKGQFSVDEGFRRLLAGSGLRLLQTPAGWVLQAGVPSTATPPTAPAAPSVQVAPVAPTITPPLPAQLPLVTTHGRLEDDPLEQRMSLSAAKIIIGRDEIEAFGDASMGEVIRRMPSISFAGPPGENNDARIRGLAKEYTQILIDGQPAPGRDFAIDQIPAHLVERLEIIRSTTANVDNQGMAGTVNIILRKPPREDSHRRWHAAVSSMPAVSGRTPDGALGLSLGERVGRLRYQLDGVLQQRAGLRSKDRQDFANGGAQLSNREQDHELRTHREAALSARLGWRLDATQELSLDPRYTYSSEDKERDRLKKANLADAERMDQRKTRQFLGLNGQWQRKQGGERRDSLSLQLQGTETQTDKIERRGAAGQPFTTLPGFISGADDRISEQGAVLRAASQRRLAAGHRLDFGAEFGESRWRLDKLAWKQANASDRAASHFEVDERKLALYVQDEMLVGERHVLTPGLRLEQVETRSSNSQGAGPSASRRHLQPSPSLHWLSTLDAHSNWRASVSRSIRRPKYEELAGLTESKAGTAAEPDVVGNPALRPETAWGLETSLERSFADKRGLLSLNLFHRQLSDLIEKRILQPQPGARFQQQPVNVAEARTWGLEFDGSYRLSLGERHGLTLRGNYSWMDSSLNDPATGGKRPINDQPQQILNAGIDYEFKPLKLKLAAHFNQVGRLQKVDLVGSQVRTQLQRPSRYADFSLSAPLNKEVSLRFSALNLLEAEKNRPRVTRRADGSVALFEQEDERSARSFQIRLEGRL